MFSVKSILQSALVVALCLAATAVFSPSVDASGNQANFKWVYHYDAAQNEGTLTVTIYDAACQVPTGTHVFPSVCKVNGNHIACDVNIQEAANQAYAREGYDPQAPSAQSYPFIFAEVVGKMSRYSSRISGTIIDHPSLHYSIQTSPASRSAQFNTNWTGASARSDFFNYNTSTLHAMRTTFGDSKFAHTENRNKINIHNSPASQLPFLLHDTTFEIYEPSGFELDNFTIDPPRCGFG